ncbi:hypothetical protein [Methylobacterium platani]|uniref:hypothetical protein n=1 Tax=Methylobacterium platani TaxID=427683 RepID=UPI0012E8A103|nr:hypothetical protein [Methylobacterium platani]
MRPLESEGGELAPCDGPDGSEDQALILGPPDATGGELAPIAEAADGTTAPALAADMVEGTNLFGDRAAMWSGDPSEVRAGYGIDPPYAEICLCDEVGLMAGAEAPGLAS